MSQASAEETLRRQERLLRLVRELGDEDDFGQIQVRVNTHLMAALEVTGAMFLFMSDERELVYRVLADQVADKEARVSTDETGLEPCFLHGLSLQLADLDPSKLPWLERTLALQLSSVLACPIGPRKDGHLLVRGVCLVYNKTAGRPLGPSDVERLQECLDYVSSVLLPHLRAELERLKNERSSAMLRVTENLFSRLNDLESLLVEIMGEARHLTQAERCSLFLLERDTNELVAKVFDNTLTGADDPADPKEKPEIRIPVSQGICGHVATTGKTLNIKDAYSHPLFYRGLDDATGFRTRNILCFPIKDGDGVIGVAQLCNKISAHSFSSSDEQVANTFAIYCGISIVHAQLYRKVNVAHHRNMLSNELMMYHMKVNDENVLHFTSVAIPKPRALHPDMKSFHFSLRALSEEQTILAGLAMFEDLGFIARWRMGRETLARFVLLLKKGYRNPAYHNWFHAITVAHFCYVSCKQLHFPSFLSELEILSLFVACLGHDLDHRGTNNSFQVASKSALAALYSSEGSVMERHHFAQTMCILNTPGCNIFSSLTTQEYRHVLDLIRDNILATDLAQHFSIQSDLQKMAAEGYKRSSTSHRRLLLRLIMTACDLSDQTKPWPLVKFTAKLLYREFFSQGDLEKALGSKPIEMMDRDRADIPEQQINFLDTVGIPLYRIYAGIFSEAQVLVKQVEKNRCKWIKIKQAFDIGKMTPTELLELLHHDSDESSVTSQPCSTTQELLSDLLFVHAPSEQQCSKPEAEAVGGREATGFYLFQP